MRRQLQIFLVMSILSVGLLVVFMVDVFAQEAVSTIPDDSAATVADDTAETQDWKQEIVSDRQQIKQQRDEIKTNSQAAIEEEKNLRDQIHQAVQSGDYETAGSLMEQLKTIHQENLGQKKQDLQGLKDARQELRSDRKEFRTEKMDKNDDGTVDDTERQAFKERIQRLDKDNNPPGAAGGAGTNWENRPGPQGGPGTSPDRRGYSGDIKQDTREIREDRRDIRQDTRDIRDDRRDFRDAVKSGDKSDMRQEKRELRQDSRERRGDGRELHRDKVDRRQDATGMNHDRRGRGNAGQGDCDRKPDRKSVV